MSAPVFIGDELTGAGFQLAGLQVLQATPETLASGFRSAIARAPLVIITAEVAGQLPRAELDEAILRSRPPVTIVPAAVGGAEMPALEHEVRLALGVET